MADKKNKVDDDPMAGLTDFMEKMKQSLAKAEKLGANATNIKEVEMKIEKFGKIDLVSRRMNNNRIVLEFQNEADAIKYFETPKK